MGRRERKARNIKIDKGGISMMSSYKKETHDFLQKDINLMNRVTREFEKEHWRVDSLHTNSHDMEKLKAGARELIKTLVNYI